MNDRLPNRRNFGLIAQGALMTTSTGPDLASAWSSWIDARRTSMIDVVAMLWAERALVLGLSAAICVLGLVAALTAPQTYTARNELMIVTLLTASVVALGAGLSRALARRPVKKGKPHLVLVDGGA